jgi:hypothetical protein
MPRQLQPYATPVDPKKLVKKAAAGGIDFEEYVPSLPPPIYRYSFLLERAKALTVSAQQLESATLAAIEKTDEAEYRVMQARQDVGLERANVTLQALRVNEANDGKALADAQKRRAEEQGTHFQNLINGGISAWENRALNLAWSASMVGGLIVGGTLGGGLSAASSAAAMEASYDRREEEWAFQLRIANDDVAIADVGISLALDRIDITEQEKSIADLRLENAIDTVEFLQDRFTNGALYRWMHKNLRRLYRDQLNLAISTARATQRALEFERQTSLDFIATDYWDEAREGLVGAQRLLTDLDKLDKYRLSTATRKKEIEKTISLASLMPAEFQRFRSTGVLDFETAMAWFDRDFPGHYMRLIRDVSVTVLALIPPNEGIHATLSNAGISRVMVGGLWEQLSTIYRLPESVALSGPSKAIGLFELHPNDPMLFPFEGSGVATTWRLEMPKGANRFDFATLYDVLVTIRYTAQEDRDYRAKVLEGMKQDDEGFVDTEAVRYFSLRHDFADQWYHLLNPVLGKLPEEYWDPAAQETANGKPQKPYTMALDVKTSDFVPNEDRRTIKKVTLAVQMAESHESKDLTLPLAVCFGGKKPNVELKNDRITTPVEGLSGKSPYGRWILSAGVGCGVQETTPQTGGTLATMLRDLKEQVRDLWLIVEYKAKVHYNK